MGRLDLEWENVNVKRVRSVLSRNDCPLLGVPVQSKIIHGKVILVGFSVDQELRERNNRSVAHYIKGDSSLDGYFGFLNVSVVGEGECKNHGSNVERRFSLTRHDKRSK
jgi:hypothetical protein